MKNPFALFALSVSIVLSGLVSTRSFLPAAGASLALASTPAPQTISDSATVSSAAVRIVHTWHEQKNGVTYRHTGASLGTVIGPGVILTHNHFDFHPESRAGEALTFVTVSGKMFTLPIAASQLISSECTQILSVLGAEAGKLAAQYVTANTGCTLPQSANAAAVLAVDAGTQIIRLPANIPLVPASLGDQAALDRLSGVDWLTVDYWDEARQRLAQGSFRIIRLERGLATLADPQCLIRPGDSGGGVYFKGRLVGNTWSIYVDANRPAGMFNVALLPSSAAPLWQHAPTQATTLTGPSTH